MFFGCEDLSVSYGPNNDNPSWGSCKDWPCRNSRSGSGKTSLVKNVLYASLKKIFGGYGEKSGKFDKISGDINRISSVELIDQRPIGKSSRSNPATYVKAYDDIRTIYSEQKLSKVRGYKAGHFSFNITGGRCEVCEGEGVVK